MLSSPSSNKVYEVVSSQGAAAVTTAIGLCVAVVFSWVLERLFPTLAKNATSNSRATQWKFVAQAVFMLLVKRGVASALAHLKARWEAARRKVGAGRRPSVSVDEHITRRDDLEDLKRRLRTLETEGDDDDDDDSERNRAEGWHLLSRKTSPHLSSRQYVKSNAEDRITGYGSNSMQMLVKTTFEDVAFDDVADFFIDDSFRGRWDRCFVSAESVLEPTAERERDEKIFSAFSRDDGEEEEGAGACVGAGAANGGEVVRWVRKFPAFCGLREYVIARRSFVEEDETTGAKAVYVVTKSIDYDALKPKIKRVREYYSSWRIRAVPSPKTEGAMAVETALLHYEDLGFPNSIFKLAMRTFFGWFITGLETNGLREYVKHKSGRTGAGRDQEKRGGPLARSLSRGKGSGLGLGRVGKAGLCLARSAARRKWRVVGLALSASMVAAKKKQR